MTETAYILVMFEYIPTKRMERLQAGNALGEILMESLHKIIQVGPSVSVPMVALLPLVPHITVTMVAAQAMYAYILIMKKSGSNWVQISMVKRKETVQVTQ